MTRIRTAKDQYLFLCLNYLLRNVACLLLEIKVRILSELHRTHSLIMLESTFILLKGIGPFGERRLWEHDILTWEAFLECPHPPGMSLDRKLIYDQQLKKAQDHLRSGQSTYFKKHLKQADHWRLYERFGSNALFLDIETTGGPAHSSDVTIIGLYRQGKMTSLIQGKNLTELRLQEELEESDLLVTFFGSVFDMPFLRAKFPSLPNNLPHFDLCFAARRLGLTGGLKAIEQDIGLVRPPDLLGLDGWAAVQLWNDWLQGREKSLQTLIRYNEADTKNLEPLAKLLHTKLANQFGPPSLSEDTYHISATSNASS